MGSLGCAANGDRRKWYKNCNLKKCDDCVDVSPICMSNNRSVHIPLPLHTKAKNTLTCEVKKCVFNLIINFVK